MDTEKKQSSEKESRRIIIVSGRSGSGKTVVLRILEDLGFFCVDNLPVLLLEGLVNSLEHQTESIGVSIDARNSYKEIHAFEATLNTLQKGNTIEILYLDASMRVLLKRFSETRRAHPLTKRGLSLQDAIEYEQDYLHPITTKADSIIDTTDLTKQDLFQLVKFKVENPNTQKLCILIQSFAFKKGIPPSSDFVFDVRCLPNPFWVPHLRDLCGTDHAVIDFFKQDDMVQKMINSIKKFIEDWKSQFENDNRSYLTLSIGCTGGQHRSVYIAETLSTLLGKVYSSVKVRHMHLKNTHLQEYNLPL